MGETGLSTKEIEAVHKRLTQENQDRFHHTMKGDAQEIGMLPSAAAAKPDEIDPETGKPKKKDDVQRLIERLMWENQMDDYLSDIQNDMNAYNASKERERQFKEARANRDIIGARELLAAKYGEETVRNWGDDQVWERVDDSIEEEQLTQETLAAEILEKLEDFEDRFGDREDVPEHVKSKLLNDFDDLKAQAIAAGLDYDAAYIKASDSSPEEFSAEKIGRDVERGKNDALNSKSLSEKFNLKASGVEPVSTNTLSEDQNLTAQTPAPDPLAAMF